MQLVGAGGFLKQRDEHVDLNKMKPREMSGGPDTPGAAAPSVAGQHDGRQSIIRQPGQGQQAGPGRGPRAKRGRRGGQGGYHSW